MDTVLEFQAEAPQATASERLVQGPYMAARAGFDPTTFRTKGHESTNEPPCPIPINNNKNLSINSGSTYKRECKNEREKQMNTLTIELLWKLRQDG